jgi:hypothetical protein
MMAAALMAVAGMAVQAQTVKVPDIESSVSTVLGTYTPYTIPKYRPQVGQSEPMVNGDLSNIATIGGEFPWGNYFSASERSMLQKNNLVARPEAFAGFAQAYSRALMSPELGSFVTVDAVTHGLRVTLDEATRSIERDFAAPTLASLLADLSRSLGGQLAAERNATIGDALMRLLAYVQTAQALVDPQAATNDRVRALVVAELDKIQSASGVASSSIFPNRRINYAQFAPVGYYKLDARLADYYRAKQWLSAVGFELRSASGSIDPRDARMAVLLARTMDILATGSDFQQRYQSVVEPLAFLRGNSGTDISWDMIAGSMRGYYGQFGSSSSESFADDKGLVGFVEYVNRELPTEIAAGKDYSFRLLGRQMDAGASMLDALHSQKSGAMTIMATLGSDRAAGVAGGRNDVVRAFLGERSRTVPVENWMQDLDHALLYTLHPLVETPEALNNYPRFMRSTAWSDRGLTSAFGAWVSFQHSVAAMSMRQASTATAFGRRTAGDLESEGYVEPNPEAWARLASLAALLRSGLVDGAHGRLISRGVEEKLRDIENTSAELMRIAALELDNKMLSDAQMQVIGLMGTRIAAYETFTDKKLLGNGSAVVAGVADGGVANGHPVALYVVVPRNDDMGGLMLTRGAIYSYYETDASDEAFRASLTTSKESVRPDTRLVSSYLSSDRPFAQDASKFQSVAGELPTSTAYVPTPAERKRSLPNVKLDMESNVVRRSAGELWFTVRAPRLDGSDIVVNVVNSSGQMVYRSYPVRIDHGERYDMVPIDDLQSGQYFIRITDGLDQTLASGRFLVVR